MDMEVLVNINIRDAIDEMMRYEESETIDALARTITIADLYHQWPFENEKQVLKEVIIDDYEEGSE